MTQVECAVIGAGPYGLSIAAHLRCRGLDHAIFGRPLQTWRTQMLRDSQLKSDGFATNLYEPSGAFTLRAFCTSEGLPYADTGLPVLRSTFARYGLEFQQRFVPGLIERDVLHLERTSSGYALHLEDGERVDARRVVVAAGITHFAHVPDVFSRLPAELGTHSSAHHTVEHLSGKDVVIVGAGASALDLAAGLVGVAARVRIVARRPVVRFANPPRPRSLADKIRSPMSGLGPGWKSRFCTDAPLVFHAMPARFRVEVVRRHLGPAPCWFTRDAVEGKAGFLLGVTPVGALARNGRARLSLTDTTGAGSEIDADHVVAATGYKVALERLPFLSGALRSVIRQQQGAPTLSRNFECNVAGLYFVGLAAANSFGPLLRFAFGANFAARRLAAHLASGAPGPAPSWTAAEATVAAE